ncbi:septum formation protein Maf [Prolixibacteraceae bacterium JC049]|nr:septum formation protein Maf [Prolixibacteraceae bacterium JC049]
MLQNKLKDFQVILASQSPRRQQLLKDLGLDFDIDVREVEEVFPEGLDRDEIPQYLSKLKAEPFKDELSERQLVITSDTIVWVDGEVLGKPKDREDAFRMISALSGRKHQVVSGVCLTTKEKQHAFSSVTDVYFKELTQEEITFYIDEYAPYDKAGAYGIQEWIGFIGIEKIEGSYFNVMGLPVQQLYTELMKFVS